MSRRKGETIGRMNEREFPHSVELAVPRGGFQDQDLAFDSFHREYGIPIRCGSGRQEEGQFYVRFCFPSADLATNGSARKYEPRVFGGRIVMPDELERIHKEILGLDRIESICDEMRELVEELWPALVDKLSPKQLSR
jgi:hypothetical protein